MKNPSAAPYLSEEDTWMENFHSLKQFEQAVEAQPQFNPNEIIAAMEPSVRNLVIDYVYNGEALPLVAQDELEEFAAGLGIAPQEVINMLQVAG